ncbi:hypothetical protein A7K91_02600 [Paenibacillus oryzae]|uniref:DUF4440 domain-containing protein n=1 Tax=Paenibacillus oryzae TaxID=1844972 RepID=A0A1A5YV76_9BACL|nr:hypothetical protein [Paenibacillus oryzae]OBR69290.1 hypothetical protein A7K91_02600 [Paenibacillus oryzae]
MPKSFTISALLLSMILLAACSNEAATNTPNKVTNLSAQQITKEKNSVQAPETEQPEETVFKAELAIDIKSVENQLTENERPLLDVLEKNLTALVEHNHAAFQSGFVDEKLADTLAFYYGENLQYKFTGIESVESYTNPKNQVHITVIGECLDTNTGRIDTVKMMYAIRQSDQGNWDIYTID